MGNGFDASPAVFKIPLPLNNRLVDKPGRHIVVARKILIQKTFIVPDVLVALNAVFRYKNFPMLNGVHRSGVHVDIGVNFDRCYAESPAF